MHNVTLCTYTQQVGAVKGGKVSVEEEEKTTTCAQCQFQDIKKRLHEVENAFSVVVTPRGYKDDCFWLENTECKEHWSAVI